VRTEAFHERLPRTTTAHRAGASPAPTIYGLGRPIERGEGTGLAVALDEGMRVFLSFASKVLLG